MDGIQHNSPEYLLSPQDVANILGIKNPHTIRKWYYENKMPQPDIKRHKFVRWRTTTLSEFLHDPEKWRENNINFGV